MYQSLSQALRTQIKHYYPCPLGAHRLVNKQLQYVAAQTKAALHLEGLGKAS